MKSEMNYKNYKNYNTKQREMILNLLQNNKSTHLTAEEISVKLAENGSSVGKATVYRYLDKLVSSGTVRKYHPADSKSKSACYQFIEDEKACSGHFHLKCDKCGELFHMECDFLSDIGVHINSEHHFLLNSSKTVFYGTCEKCV